MPNKKSKEGIKALYVRVSTDAQAEEGYSIQAQCDKLEAYCKVKGWTNYKFYIDGGYSGSNLDRPNMRKLIKDVKDGKVDVVVVYKLDRLSRSQKDTLLFIEDLLLPRNVGFVSLNEELDTTSPYGRAMIGIISAFAQLERENIFLRTRMGMLERVKQGYWPGGGGTPYGYIYDTNKDILVPHPEEAKIVRKIYDLYLAGKSCAAIAKIVGLKTDRAVDNVLRRKTNIGLIPYKGEVYQGKHEPIISKEIFDLTQAELLKRSTKHRTTNKTHLLSGLLYCGECGARMRYIKWGKGQYKLVCYGKDKSKKHMHRAEECNSEPVWADEVENFVLGDLFNLSADVSDSEAYAFDDVIDPLKEIETRMSEVENKLKRLYNLYAVSEDDILLETINDCKKELQILNQQRDEEAKYSVGEKKIQIIRDQVASIRETWDYMNAEEQYRLIHECVDKIIIYSTKNTIEIFYTFTKK